MRVFRFTALDQTGRRIEGSLDAESAKKLAADLRAQGLIPLRVWLPTCGKQAAGA
jgi:type II secretory pathway component PulF